MVPAARMRPVAASAHWLASSVALGLVLGPMSALAHLGAVANLRIEVERSGEGILNPLFCRASRANPQAAGLPVQPAQHSQLTLRHAAQLLPSGLRAPLRRTKRSA